MNGKIAPARAAIAVTPSDSVDLDPHANTLWVGSAGTVRITDIDGNIVDIVGADKHIPIRAKRVWATGTTASSILALI